MLLSWWLSSISGPGLTECFSGAMICPQKQGANSSWWQLLHRLQSLDRCYSSLEVQHGGCQSWVVVLKPLFAEDDQAATWVTPQHCWGTT